MLDMQLPLALQEGAKNAEVLDRIIARRSELSAAPVATAVRQLWNGPPTPTDSLACDDDEPVRSDVAVEMRMSEDLLSAFNVPDERWEEKVPQVMQEGLKSAKVLDDITASSQVSAALVATARSDFGRLIRLSLWIDRPRPPIRRTIMSQTRLLVVATRLLT